ncbi:MAG: hypothetical protein PHE78_02495 [Candidatus Gastranaerophilales bacterium]|jgi:hypothetical protein|nr:hypothetical protein [Candidatus Gastranaerophilales bacterium]
MTNIKFSLFNNTDAYKASSKESAIQTAKNEQKARRLMVALPENASINAIKTALYVAQDEMEEMDKLVLSNANKLHK